MKITKYIVILTKKSMTDNIKACVGKKDESIT